MTDQENKREPSSDFAYTSPYTKHHPLTSTGEPGYTTDTSPLLFLQSRAAETRTSDAKTESYALFCTRSSAG